MSLKKRKQSECNEYVGYWDNCMQEVSRMEKLLLLELRESIDEYQEIIDKYDADMAVNELERNFEENKDIIDNGYISSSKYDESEGAMWPYIVAPIIAMIIAYAFGYDPSEHMGPP